MTTVSCEFSVFCSDSGPTPLFDLWFMVADRIIDFESTLNGVETVTIIHNAEEVFAQ